MQSTEKTVQPKETAVQSTKTKTVQPTETAMQSTETAMKSTETAMQSTETAVQPTETAMQSTETTTVQPTETAMQSTETAMKSTETAMQSTKKTVQPTEKAMQSTETAVQSTETAVQPIETAMHSTETAMQLIETTIMHSLETSNAWRFSYTVARTLNRLGFNLTWNVIEKGYNKSVFRTKISYATIKKAASFLKKHILETPCYQSERILNSSGFNIYLKKELYQLTDSIKARGVIYSLLHLSKVHRCRGVITISSGSFAFVLSHYTYRYQIPVTVVLPTTTTDEKIMMCKAYPLSRVFVKGNNLLEAHRAALDIAMSEGLFYLDGYFPLTKSYKKFDCTYTLRTDAWLNRRTQMPVLT
ncbi:Zonadhesin [Trachymyrmex cornetzi]|uniref:L-serine deaminase n=1 Tax=Trachymyrmex cornetzi TaxID=471704 RepID=A0A195DLP3_9HYME|nr:Zonadhesin [Trachymyrmex cornetzi]